MWPESEDNNSSLRTGLTTGSCATACSLAAAKVLLQNQRPPVVSITLPKGKTVELKIENYQRNGEAVRAACIKDAGDDPDVTHGAILFAEVMLDNQPGVQFRAGQGVGTVTREGLLLAVGEPAINPVPRQMMKEHLIALAASTGYGEGFIVTIGIVNGEAIAKKTMNARLGIVGGLSILGTTGIVRPFSCAAWIASIRQGIDVANANGIAHIAASTGNASEQAIKHQYQLSQMALIEMGDFVGAVLKHLKQVPVARLSICGGFGKITKLANGCMDLNSRVSSIDFAQLATVAARAGAERALLDTIEQANTSIEVYKRCLEAGVDIATPICKLALEVARRVVPKQVSVEVWAINRQGEIIARAGDVGAQ